MSAEETAQVVGESPNHLELTTRSASAGLLVLSEDGLPWLAGDGGWATGAGLARRYCLARRVFAGGITHGAL